MKQAFLKDIRVSFGCGGFVCSLSEKDLGDFHHYLERGFPLNFDEPSKVKKGVQSVGEQTNDIWVLNEDTHINSEGQLIALDESQFSWQPIIGGPCTEGFGKRNVVGQISLHCDILKPLDYTHCIPKLLRCMQEVFRHNFIASECSERYVLRVVFLMQTHNVMYHISSPCASILH